MSILKPIDPSDATGTTKEIFEHLAQNMNRIPAMVRVMAHSPAITETYVHFNQALAKSSLSQRTLALITVAVAEINGCDYTLSIGIALAKRHGVEERELAFARAGRAEYDKTARTLEFATSIVRRAGQVPHADLERLRQNGFSDREIVDIIGAVGLNIFRNYFNLVVGTDIDVPVVRTGRSTQPVS
jgi:uncharacterized peroxidase-related enzyme